MLKSGIQRNDLEETIITAVGREGLALTRERCGASFSQADLQRTIEAMKDGPERRTLVTVERLVDAAHRAFMARINARGMPHSSSGASTPSPQPHRQS